MSGGNDGAVLFIGLVIGFTLGFFICFAILKDAPTDKRITIVQACQRENHTLAECLDAADRLVPVKGCQ